MKKKKKKYLEGITSYIAPIMIWLLIGGVAVGGVAVGASVIFPYQGGTGTDSVPTLGQLMVTEVAGIYAPSAAVGIGDEAPDAILEITTSEDAPTLTSFFMVSTVSTADGDIFIINGDNKVGVGDTTPDAILEVTTNTLTTASDLFYISSGSGKDGDFLAVDDQGNIGIGDSTPDGRFDVLLDQNANEDSAVCITSGNVLSDETDSTCDASSIKVKTDISKLTYGIDTVMQLNPVFFRYKKEFKPDYQVLRAGFIAEEMYEIIPEVTTWDNEGIVDGIDYKRLTAVTVSAIQEQQRMIEGIEIGDPSGLIKGLEVRLELLENKVAKLEAKIEKLETETIEQSWWDKLVEYFRK